ncbi:unnamed protein product [Brachionus calyciflorus]|uniref:C-type lectin domain-containing protein n=1 Tax=Brachionus calyciflorus TaxID=104777 RepID=A0A814E224_9BILA|nr:unnamed protein product [Brachionus calyciflorus]
MFRKLILFCMINLSLCQQQAEPLPSENYGRIFSNSTRNLPSDNRAVTCTSPLFYGFVQRAGTTKYYATADLQMNWIDAQNYCNSLGANLPVARSAVDIDFFRWFVGGKFMKPSYEIVSSFIVKGWSGYWLGMYNSLETNSWRWIDNSPFINPDWDKPSQPEGGLQHFGFDLYDIVQKKHKGWHDWHMHGYNLVLCELKC